MRDYNETISLLPLFAGIEPAELDGMLTCLNSCVRQYKKINTSSLTTSRS